MILGLETARTPFPEHPASGSAWALAASGAHTAAVTTYLAGSLVLFWTLSAASSIFLANPSGLLGHCP